MVLLIGAREWRKVKKNKPQRDREHRENREDLRMFPCQIVVNFSDFITHGVLKKC
jgi:hypothetical protein